MRASDVVATPLGSMTRLLISITVDRALGMVQRGRRDA